MSTFKKSLLAILTVSSTIIMSDSMGAITIPCDENTWRLGATALYLQPSFGGNGLGYSSFSNFGTDINNVLVEVNGAPNNMSNIEPKWGWGFQIEGSTTFGRGHDLDVNWYHSDNHTHGHLPLGTLFAGSASALYAGQLDVSPRWDAVNIEFGQTIAFCEQQIMRLHAGIEFARIKSTFVNYPQRTASGDAVFVTTDAISYSGLGPRFGADYHYGVGCGWGVYAKAAGSLLVGTSKQNVTGYRDLGGFNLYSTGNYAQSHDSVVVTELEAKLGLAYDYKIPQGNLGFDLGYMWVTYLDSMVSQVGAGVVSSAISNSSAANFDLNGVYLGITWTCA